MGGGETGVKFQGSVFSSRGEHSCSWGLCILFLRQRDVFLEEPHRLKCHIKDSLPIRSHDTGWLRDAGHQGKAIPYPLFMAHLSGTCG